MHIALTTAAATMGYKPSPRPTYDRPTAIPFADVTRHTWGNPEAGLVDDWIYVSSDNIHTIIFGLDPGESFRHSEDFRTIFGADEVLHVLQGTFVIANPENGEVHRVEAGESVFFRKDTWHHGFSYGAEPVRVLEFFAPPPSTGTSGPYARTKEYLPQERWSYGDDDVIGSLLSPVTTEGTMRVISPSNRSHRLEGGALVGLIASTDHLTVAALRLVAGGATNPVTRGGDVLIFVESGATRVEADWNGEQHVFELGRWDAAYVPKGGRYRIQCLDDAPADLIVGVAPSYLAD